MGFGADQRPTRSVGPVVVRRYGTPAALHHRRKSVSSSKRMRTRSPLYNLYMLSIPKDEFAFFPLFFAFCQFFFCDFFFSSKKEERQKKRQENNRRGRQLFYFWSEARDELENKPPTKNFGLHKTRARKFENASYKYNLSFFFFFNFKLLFLTISLYLSLACSFRWFSASYRVFAGQSRGR